MGVFKQAKLGKSLEFKLCSFGRREFENCSLLFCDQQKLSLDLRLCHSLLPHLFIAAFFKQFVSNVLTSNAPFKSFSKQGHKK
jgi:hypothetical protein